MAIMDQATVMGYSFLFCALVYGIGRVGFQALLKSYSALSEFDKTRWNLSFVRSVFAFVGAYIGFRVLLWETELIEDVAFGTSSFSRFAASFTIGFFIWENVTLYWLYIVYNYVDKGLIIHHALSLICFSSVLISGSLQFILLSGLIEELSAPFTAFGWVLSKLRYDGSRLWLINQFCLVFVWIFFRVLIDAILVYNIVVNWSTVSTVHWSVLSMVLFGLVILACFLNPYWFYMKAGRLIQALRGQQVPMSPVPIPHKRTFIPFGAGVTSIKPSNKPSNKRSAAGTTTTTTPPPSPNVSKNKPLQNGHSKDHAASSPKKSQQQQKNTGISQLVNGIGNHQKQA